MKKKKMMFTENCHFNFTGEVFIKIGKDLKHDDVVNNPDRHLKNIIVDSASLLLARWANQTTSPASFVSGITYLAVGTGDPGWDPFNPPLQTVGTTQLVTEAARVIRTNTGIPFVDPNTFINQATPPTWIVDFEFTFPGGLGGLDAILVEMGLFGGDASGTANSGTMFNYLTFSAISKPANAEMALVWRINFLPQGI
jgi:hypothetical protein